MDGQSSRDREMVERYLHGTLTADEERAFEEAYLADSSLLDELILTEKLQHGLKHLRASHGEEDTAAAPDRGARWRRTFGSVPYAAAATVLLGLSIALSTVLFVENRNLETLSASPGAAPTRMLPLVTVRGNNAANRVEAPSADEWAVLLADAGFADYDDYRVTLTRRAGGTEERVARLAGLTSTYDGQVGLGVPGSVLTPGDYELSLEGRSSAAGFELITRIPLTVTPRP